MLVAAACARQPETPVDYTSIIGIAQKRFSRDVCLQIPTVLKPGTVVTLIDVHISTDINSGARAAAVSRTVERDTARVCGDPTYVPMRERNDSMYFLGRLAEAEEPDPLLFALVLPKDAVELRGDSAFARVAPEAKISFRMCTSSEGVHLSAWIGSPLTGTRVWHRYHYLGYDTEPSCVAADFKGLN